jgi:hypothetical protein
MRGQAGEARQPEAWAGRGTAALTAGSGWAGHDWAIQTCAYSRRRWQQSRRSAVWRSGVVHVVVRRACARCGDCCLSHKGAGTRGAERARSLCCRQLPCAFPARSGFTPRRATQASTGNARAALRCAARTVPRGAGKARAVPRRVGNAR